MSRRKQSENHNTFSGSGLDQGGQPLDTEKWLSGIVDTTTDNVSPGRFLHDPIYEALVDFAFR